MNNQPPLLPCPFCGGEAESYQATERMMSADGSLNASWVVDCSQCDCNLEGDYKNQDEAIRQWNTRAAPKPQSDEGLAWSKVEWDAYNRLSARCVPGSDAEHFGGQSACIIQNLIARYKIALQELSRQAPVPTTNGGKAHE